MESLAEVFVSIYCVRERWTSAEGCGATRGTSPITPYSDDSVHICKLSDMPAATHHSATHTQCTRFLWPPRPAPPSLAEIPFMCLKEVCALGRINFFSRRKKTSRNFFFSTANFESKMNIAATIDHG